MKINLISCYYKSNNIIRQQELDFCKEKNIEVGFDNIFFWDEDYIPTYNQLFEIANKTPEDINVIANGDIFFEENSLEQLKYFFTNYDDDMNKVCLALSRWEYVSDGNHSIKWSNQSQDVWCFLGKIDYNYRTDFQIGTPGCDNRVAGELYYHMNYKVLNPSYSIRTIHYHNSGDSTRTYYDKDGNKTRHIPGPYYFINPTHLEMM